MNLRTAETIASGAGDVIIPGLSATITPKSSSSKILVISHVAGVQPDGAGRRLVAQGGAIMRPAEV